MEVSLQLPDSAGLTDTDPQFLREALVATLYHIGRLSEREACEILGIGRRAFEDLLPRFGFSVLADDDDTIEAELLA